MISAEVQTLHTCLKLEGISQQIPSGDSEVTLHKPSLIPLYQHILVILHSLCPVLHFALKNI